MDIKSILEINPVLLVTIIGALGLKDILWEWVKRYWLKSDEKETDHKNQQKMQESIDEILKRLEEIEKQNKEFTTNDMMLIEDRLLWMQRKAIDVQKVSRGCMPRYKALLKRYRELNDKTDIDLNEEVDFNDIQINKLIADGKVVDTWEDTLK